MRSQGGGEARRDGTRGGEVAWRGGQPGVVHVLGWAAQQAHMGTLGAPGSDRAGQPC